MFSFYFFFMPLLRSALQAFIYPSAPRGARSECLHYSAEKEKDPDGLGNADSPALGDESPPLRPSSYEPMPTPLPNTVPIGSIPLHSVPRPVSVSVAPSHLKLKELEVDLAATSSRRNTLEQAVKSADAAFDPIYNEYIEAKARYDAAKACLNEADRIRNNAHSELQAFEEDIAAREARLRDHTTQIDHRKIQPHEANAVLHGANKPTHLNSGNPMSTTAAPSLKDVRPHGSRRPPALDASLPAPPVSVSRLPSPREPPASVPVIDLSSAPLGSAEMDVNAMVGGSGVAANQSPSEGNQPYTNQ